MVDLDKHYSPLTSEYSSLHPPSSASPLSSGGESGSALSVPKVRRKPMPRKGHKKSRNGCYSCKRRKVKCQENLPECYNCKRIGLKCEYPTITRVSLPHPATEAAGEPTAPVHSHGGASSFSMEDMRFFHHFLFTAYPPLPIGGSEVWKNVGALSHNYDFLMHAMLGLAASHLTLSTGVDYSSQALTHRISAINRLNEALSIPCTSRADGDARFATALALTFQSSYMPDGMSDFVRMMRGCAVIAGSAMPSFEDSMFQIFSQENHIKQVNALLKQEGGETPLVDAVADEYLDSVRKLAPLCVSVTEVGYLAAIERTIKVAKSSPIEAQGEYVRLFTLSNYISNDEFVAFTDPNNHGAKLLLLHVYLCEYVLATLRSPVLPHNGIRKQVVYHWVQRVVGSLPAEYKEYAEWAVRFAQEYVWNPEDGSKIMSPTDAEEYGSAGGLEEAAARGIRYETESVGSGVMGSPAGIATGSPATSAGSPSSGIGLGVMDLDLVSDVSSSGLEDSQGMLDSELSLDSLIANPPVVLDDDWLSLAVADANAQLNQMQRATQG